MKMMANQTQTLIFDAYDMPPQPDYRQAKRAGRRQRREGAKQPHADPHPCAVVVGAQRLEGRCGLDQIALPVLPKLTRFACWAFVSAAPFGHSTDDHLDLVKSPGSLSL